MPSNLDRFKQDLGRLIELGYELFHDIGLQAQEVQVKKGEPAPGNRFHAEYQRWYTEALTVVQQILPQRVDEFRELYEQDHRRKSLDAVSFSIQDWLLGIRSTIDQYSGKKHFNDAVGVAMRYKTQLEILEAAQASFTSSLFQIRQLIQADLFDSEIDAARSLLSHGFGRAAGAMCGVVLEAHLAEVCANHKIKVTKKIPTIGDLNELLKGGAVIDVPTWRFITHLGDIRNLCDHKKAADPTEDQVADLIDGTDKITKTIA